MTTRKSDPNPGDLAINTSVILSRAMLAARAGQQFGGARDLYQVLGYKRGLAFADHYARFRRQNIARRIITSKPSATLKESNSISSKAPFLTRVVRSVRSST